MRYYLIFFLLLEIAIVVFFYKEHEKKISQFKQADINLLEKSFDMTTHAFEMANDDFYSQHSYEIAKLTSAANGASTEVRDKIRATMLASLMSFFSNKKLYSLEGMHIFDKMGYSLLRFHKPEKHDDAIVELRESLINMQKDFRYKKGLELGVYKESYRYQYPLFYDGEFVGSYEYSVPFEVLKKEMEKFSNNHYFTIYTMEDIEDVASAQTIAKRYEKFRVGDQEFYIQDELFYHPSEKEQFDYALKLKDVQDALQATKTKVVSYRYQGDHFDILIKPLLDINQKHIGYILAFIPNEYMTRFRHELFLGLLLATLVNMLLLLFVVKQVKHRIYVRELLNMQHDMLIVTDGEKIKDANKTLLEFFDYDSLHRFVHDHKCVCKFFLEGDGYLQESNDGLRWTEYMLQNKDKVHQVKMKDISDGSIKIFELQFSMLEKSEYLFIVFTDVTNEVAKVNSLMDKAYHDSLTGIYNRSSFEYHLKKELQRSSRSQELFSLIMFDIDHFKSVNDTYGHDVGDSVLKELASLISSHIRDIDVFSRWGGEEFMLISATGIGMSGVFAEKLRERIESHEFKYVSRITCSFGITQYRYDDTDESMIKRVDEALYESKEKGRNQVSVR